MNLIINITLNALLWRHNEHNGGLKSPAPRLFAQPFIQAQITENIILVVYSGTDQRKHQSSASLAFVRGIHRSPVNSPHKWPVTRKMFPFDDVIMDVLCWWPSSKRLSGSKIGLHVLVFFILDKVAYPMLGLTKINFTNMEPMLVAWIIMRFNEYV